MRLLAGDCQRDVRACHGVSGSGCATETPEDRLRYNYPGTVYSNWQKYENRNSLLVDRENDKPKKRKRKWTETETAIELEELRDEVEHLEEELALRKESRRLIDLQEDSVEKIADALREMRPSWKFDHLLDYLHLERKVEEMAPRRRRRELADSEATAA